jgi:UDP-N-acetylmuramoyl-tripeptide--D-alanyl-D-alanine ligase
MTFAALSGPLKAYRSEGNYNNLFGLPLALLRMPAGTQVAVLEMGMSYAGEIRRLTEIAAPNVGVLLNIGRAHLANFASQEGILNAKAELFEGMGSRGTGIFNADDDRARRVADSFEGFVFTFGIDRPADLEASQVTTEGFTGMRLNIRHGGSVWPAQLGFVGVHHVYNLLAALAAGFMLGCDLPGMIERVGMVTPLAGRGERLELPGNLRVIDDTYNSNPAALRRAIGALAAAAAAGSRRVLVTGDMLELGEHGPEAHREAGRVAADARIEALVAVGPLSEETAEAARERGMKEVTHFVDAGAAAAAVSSWVRPGDTLLVKGSRGMRMERIVSALRNSMQERKTH